MDCCWLHKSPLWVLCFDRSVSTAKVHKDLRDLGEQGPIWLREGHPRWMERMSYGWFVPSFLRWLVLLRPKISNRFQLPWAYWKKQNFTRTILLNRSTACLVSIQVGKAQLVTYMFCHWPSSCYGLPHRSCVELLRLDGTPDIAFTAPSRI